ncbi:surface anchored protein [Streptococcus pneumoniae]|nr:surface anchored protein [Streptococcus pneumoniae]
MDFGKYNKEKVFRYSIRKYHFGAASVAVAALMFFANGVAAQAPAVSSATASDVVAGSSGNSDGNPGTSDEEDSSKASTSQPAELKAPDEVKTQEAPAEETNQGQAGAESNSAQSETNPANQEPSQAGEVKEQEQPTVADTTAAKSTQGNLQALLEKLTLSSMQELHAEVEARLAAAKAVLEDPKATQAQVDEQARLMAELMSRVNQALTPSLDTPTILEKAGLASTGLTSTGLATSEGATTAQTSGGKGRRRTLSEPTSDEKSAGGDSTGSGTSSQATPRELPTYTNTTEGKNGVYGLKDELEFITEQLRANGASADKIQAAKAAADKFNEAFSKGNTISQEDFSAALTDLKKSRELIEGVLREKDANAGEVTGPVNQVNPENPSENNVTIQPRTNTRGWSGFRNVPAGTVRTRNARAAGQNRDGSNSFANSLEYYLEDGRKGNSPYERFTYVYYTERNSRGRDENNKPVSGAEEYLYADLTKINGGWKWDIYLNNGHHELDSERVWFTLPKTHTIVENSVNINRKNQNGTSTSKGFNNLRDGLTDSFVGFKNLSVGTPKRSDIRREPNDWERTQNFNTNSLNDLARQDAASLRPRLLNNNAADKKLVDDKFTKINESNSDLYSFLTNGTRDAYRISFITKSNDRPEDLVTAFGVRGVRQSNGTFTHYLVNQWHARAASEIGDVDRFKFRVSGNGYFKVDQHTAYVNFAPDYAIKTGTKVKQEGNNIASNYPNQIDKPLDAGTKGVLTFASDNTANTAFEIDMTSYGDYYDANGKLYEKQTGKGLANNKGQKFQLMSNKGTPMTKKEVTIDAISTPGVHTYRYNRWFEKEANGDGSHDTGKFSIVTKPKTPTIKTDLTRVAGVASNIEVSGGTKGYDVILYKKEGDTLVSVKGSDQQPIKATADANGVATFSGLKLEIGTYVAKTVVEGDWTDYDGTEKHDVSSDPSAEKAATDGVPPVVQTVGTNTRLPETRTASDAGDALYEVVQGQPFRPQLEAWDNTGNLTKFRISNLPTGVTATNANDSFRQNNNATESNTFGPVRFTGNVPNNMATGTYTSTITVNDGSSGDKQYFFKYRVIARDNEAPTVTMNGKTLTENAADNRFVIYRGATFNPTFTVSDNSGTVSSFKMSGGPAGVWFNKNGNSDDAKTNLTSGTSYQLTTNNVVDTNAALGTNEASVVVSDANNNAKTYKFQYTVVDIQPKNSPKDVAVNSTLGNPQDYLKVVDNSSGTEASKYLPNGVTYKWFDTTTLKDTPNSTVLSEVGRVTKYYATAAFPQSNSVKKRIDNVEHTIYYPANAPRPVVFNVQDTVAPTVKLTNKANNNTEVTLTTDPSVTTIDVYRGATIELPLKYYDNANTGKVNIGYKEGLPKGVLFNSNESATTSTTINESGKTETTPGTYTVRGRVATDATLGVQTVTLKVSDDANGNVDQGNKKEVKFNIRVLDIDFEGGHSQATGTTKITKEVALNQQTPDPNEYLTATTGTGAGTGITRNDNLFPRDMTFRYITGENDNEFRTTLTFTAPGKYLVKAGAFYPTTYVPTNGLSTTPANATGDRIDEIRNRTYTTREIEFDVKPTAPTVTAEANGDVVVTHTNQTNVNTLSFTYTDKDNNQRTVTATKTGNTWALTNAPADGVTIEATSGAVTIKDRQVRDTTAVTAKVVAQNVESTVSTGTSLAGEKTAPTFTFSDKYTSLENGERVVYVTPTEDLANGSITLGTVKDDSGKLREVLLYHGDGRSTNMDFGLDYNKKASENNVEFSAPFNIEITGKLPRENRNTRRIWSNGDNIVTRYVGATDAADNKLQNFTNNAQNPTRVVIKVLTQAAKYEATINAQTLKKDLTVSGVSVTEAEFNKMKPNLTFSTNRGDVKVAYNSPDMNIAMKDGGAIKSEGGSYYVGATITYPDGSTKDIRIPVENADKVAPTVKLTNKTDENRVVTLNANESTSPVVTVYRGANLNLPLTFFDNDSDGRVNLKYVSGLPSGIQFNGNSDTLTETGKTQDSVGTHTITGRIPANAQLGLTTVTLKVSDGSNGVDSGNQAEVKFRLKVVDLDFEPSRSTQANQSSITVAATAGQRLEDANNYLTVNDGTNRQDAGNFPSGMTFRMVNEAGQVITNLPDAPGRHVVKARAYFPAGYAGTDGIGTEVTGNADSELNGRRYIEKTINFEVKPKAPVVSPQDNGDVLITQANETNVNRLKVTYTTQGTNPQEVTYTASKNGDTWSFGSGTPITIDGVTGTVKIKDRSVKDGSTVKVTAFMTTNGNLESSEATGVAKDGDPIFPTVEFQNVETDAAGNRVVYITPTEDTNLPVATFKDNSNKLSQAGFVEYNGNLANLGGVGIDYERYPASGDTTYPAPKTLTVTGTLNKYRTGSTLWNNDETIVTRYASVIDAAGNDLHTVDGNKVNANTSPTRVLFKVRTQATKYTPTITPQRLERDIALSNAAVTQTEFDAMKQNLTFTTTKGDVKVAYNTQDMSINLKDNGAITHNPTDNTYSIGASITYPDGSTEDIQIPVTAPSQKDIYTPTAVEKTVEKDSQPEARDSIENATSLPENTRIEWKAGTLNTSTPGVKQATITVAYPDGTSEDVERVTVNVKPSQPTVTPSGNGDVTVTPVTEATVDKLEVTYTPADNNQLQDNGDVTKTPQTPTTIVATKGDDNRWTITSGQKDGISIDATTGAITLKDQVVKDQADVTAKVAAQSIESNKATAQAGNGDQTAPVIGASSKIIEAEKTVDIPLGLSDAGVGIDEGNIIVSGLPSGLIYDDDTQSIKGTLRSVSQNNIKVTVLDKNGNKADKTITITAVKPKAVYAIKDATVANVANAANFVEVPEGVTLTSATWKNGEQPTTDTVGTTTKTVEVSLNGVNTELTIPVTVYPGVTLRKVNNQEVATYQEVVSQPLTSAVWGTQGRTQAPTADFYVAFEGNRPAGTTVEFKDGLPLSTVAGETRHTIVVTYPNGAGTVEKTVTFRTYGYETNYPAGKEYFETEVGKPFANAGAGSYVKPSSNLSTPSRIWIGWGNHGLGASPVQSAQRTIGVREENVNVYYGTTVQNQRGDTSNLYSEQDIKVALAVKPKAPTLQGQAGTKPAVTVSNLPETSQLATGSTVKVQLKDAQGNVVAEKDVPAGTTTVTFAAADYKKDLTLGEQLTTNVLVSGTYKKTIAKNTTEDTAYEVSSAKSDSVTVKTYADYYRDQVTYPTNAEKVTYGNSDIANGNFTDAAKERFAAKIKEVNANNSNLPAGVTYTKGTTDDKSKVATINFPDDGSTIDISHAQVAKPTVPTFNATVGSGEDAKLSDVDRTISGTALESATKVVLTLQTGKTVEIDANNGKDPATLQPGEGALKNGVWTYKLPDNTYLRQTDQTAEIGSSDQPVKVKQTVFTAESDESKIYVAKERNFAGKTITAAKGSQTLTDLRADARKGIKYTEKNVEKDFPGDFTATWKDGQPDVDTVGTRTYKVQLTETSATGTNKVVGEYDVTITVTNPAPAELTYENKQNGETVVTIPEDADEVVFTVPTSDTNVNTITVSKANGWTADGIEKRGNTWVFPANSVQGNRQVTAVATAGSGDTKSVQTPTSIAVPSHEVETTKISKVVGGSNPTAEELLDAVTVDHKVSAALKDGTTYPTALGTHTIEVVVTYADNTTEIVEVPYEVRSADKSALTQAKDGLSTDITSGAATAGKTEASKKAYEDAKAEANTAVTEAETVIANANATEQEVAAAKDKVDAAKTKLDNAKAGLVDVDKTALTNAKNALQEDVNQGAATAGKTEASKKAYEDAKAEANTAVTEAETVIANANATEQEVAAAKDKVDAAKTKLDNAKAGLVDKPTSVPSNDANTNNGDNTDNSSNSNTSGDTNNSANTNNGGTTTPADSNSDSVTPDNSGNTPAPGVTTDDSSNSNPATPSSTVGQAQASTPAQETPVSTNTPNTSGNTVTPSETRPVDKSELARLVEELETRLKDLDAIDQSVIDAAKVILGEGQEALRNADLTEAGLREITAKVKEVLESLKGKQVTKDEEEMQETSKEQGHLPYGTMIGSLLALLGLLLFLIARRKKESELKKLTKELTKVLQESDLTSVDAKVLDQAREALAQAVAFLANEKESDHTEDELIEKLKAILAQLR